jgi:hypothetical protein
MTGVPKVIGYDLAMSFFTLMLMMSTLAPQIQSVYAGGKSPFESGYDHGCILQGLSYLRCSIGLIFYDTFVFT